MKSDCFQQNYHQNTFDQLETSSKLQNAPSVLGYLRCTFQSEYVRVTRSCEYGRNRKLVFDIRSFNGGVKTLGFKLGVIL